MKLSTFILIASLVQVSAAGFAQKITLNQNKASLKEIFSEIKKQTGYDVFYQAGKVNEERTIKVNFSNTPLEEVMKRCLEGQALSFVIDERTVLIKEKAPSFLDRVIERFTAIDVRGIVLDENGNPLPGASVKVKGVNKVTKTDTKGEFFLQGVTEDVVLQISYIGYKTQEIKASSNLGTIKMELGDSELDEVTVSTGYWTIDKRKNVGNIGKVTAKDIENQPVTSPLLALQGRIAGVEVTPTSGVPGSALKIQIRGQNSLRTSELFPIEGGGNLPLYVIDGVPVNSTPISTSSSSLVSNGFDPLSGLNTSNISSIEVLKDADATAIYGSRGANGVILITTKSRGNSVGYNIDFNIYRGVGKIAKKVELLNTEQYLEMRHEAIKNDGGTVIDNYNNTTLGPLLFPDLLFWDTTRQTNWQDTFMGESSDIIDGHLRINTGNSRTSLSVGGKYHNETLLYAGDFGYLQYNADVSVNHTSSDSKLKLNFNSSYNLNKHNIFDNSQMTNGVIGLAPNAPELYSEDGSLNWMKNAFFSTWSNPLAWLRSIHESNINNLISNLVGSYQITKDLSFKTNLGFSKLDQNERITIPISSLDPNGFDFTGTKDSRSTNRSSWIIEPQILFNKTFGKSTINSLIGASIQQATNLMQGLRATGYTSDALIGTLDGASMLRSTSENSQYRYGSILGRIGYEYGDKYFVNVTARRDGSSRFGPGNKYAFFGAVGAGWIFTNENFLNNSSILSFGKLRASLGSTGNDQIGDSKYLKTYSIGEKTYHGGIVLVPTALFNYNYAWEVTTKFEAGIELGFINDKISVEGSYYRNRSSNQLVDYTLPDITGFPSVFKNFDATVENTGIELGFNTSNISNATFNWSTSANISLPSNKLIDFPDIDNSPYATIFQVGQPLSTKFTYVWEGVDPMTGLHTFKDLNMDGVVDDLDRKFTKSLETKYFGGINNSLAFKSIELSFLVQFSNRVALNNYFTLPGTRNNQPVSVLRRWQQPGDITDVQKFTTGSVFENSSAFYQFSASDGIYENVKFIRLKALTLSHSLPAVTAKKLFLRGAKVFVQGQNLLTMTNFKGWDPETIYSPPPLRILSGGIQLML